MKVGTALKTVFLFSALLMVSRVYGYTAADYTNAGLKVYAQKNYALAIRYFTAAINMVPPDPRALQARANCYYFLGQYQAALADYEKLMAQNPSGPVSQFVQALRAKLDASAPATQAAPSGAVSTAPATTTAAPNAATTVVSAESAPTKPSGFGLRLVPAFAIVNLADFNTDTQTNQANAILIQKTDPSYQFNSTVPSAYVGVGLEPVMQIGSSGLEIGLPFTVLPVGKVSQSASDNTGYNQAISYDLNAFSVGLNARYAFGNGVVRPFIGAGGLLVPIGISYTNIANYPPNPTSSASGSFSGTAFGGQGQAGVDFHVGGPFVISLFGGYQLATANSFKGSITVSGSGTTTTYPGQLGIAKSLNGYQIYFLQDGTTAPASFQPLQVDLSGVIAGIHLSVFF